MQEHPERQQIPARPENSNPSVTRAVGLGDTIGRLRARRSSLFAQTIIWVTGLICLALLLGSFAQAWSNSQLMLRVRAAQQQAQQQQNHNSALAHLVNYHKDPSVIESEARQQLGYVRPGEHPVVIVSGATQEQQPVTTHVSSPPPQGFWQEWWDVFFGN